VGFGTPYLIGHSTAGSGQTQTITAGTATSPGDAIIVAHSSSSTSGATISSMSDSAGNSYSRIIPAANTTNEFGDLWAALPQNNGGTTAALTTSNTITVNWSTSTGEKLSVAAGVPGVNVTSAVDQDPAPGHGTSTSPTVSTSTLAQSTEMAIGVLNNPDTDAPSSVNLTQLTQQQSATSPYVTICYEQTSSTTAVTFGGTLPASLNWCAMLVTLLPAAPAVTAAAPAQVPPPRPRGSSRAVIRGLTVAPLIAAALTGGHAYQRASPPHRLVWHGTTVTTVNVSGPSGTVQPRATIPVPRRAAARAVWARETGPGNAHGPSGIPPLPHPQPRRQPARAVWRGTVTRGSNATTIGTPALVFPRQQPRRQPSRAVWHGTITAGSNAAAIGTPAVIRPPAPLRRQPARALWRGMTAAVQHGVPGTGKLPAARRIPGRAVWRGTLTPGTVAPGPAPRQRPPIPRRTPVRAVWTGIRTATVNALPVAVPPPAQRPAIPRRTTARAVWAGTITPGTLRAPGITTITVTGTCLDYRGAPLPGPVVFDPGGVIIDAAGRVILGGPVTVPLSTAGTFSVVLPCTDNAGLSPAGWQYTVSITLTVPAAAWTPATLVQDLPVPVPPASFRTGLPSALGPATDLSALV